MKKTISIIVVILLIGMHIPVQPTRARELTPPEEKCEPIRPDYTDLSKKWLSQKKPTSNDINKAYNETQKAYHRYVECIFKMVESNVLFMTPPTLPGTIQANTTNAEYLIDWLSPPAACLPDETVNKVLEDTSPIAILPPLLSAHREYADYLQKKILPKYAGKGVEVDKDGRILRGYDQITKKAGVLAKIEKQFQEEIDNALIAMDITFLGLKELRLAFVMHVQFQCMLNNLEKYRKLMEEIRIIVDSLPGQLRDASIH